jgi:uncharacterized Zn finger protein
MLAELLNEPVLKELAGERAFTRGAEYFASGLVSGLKDNSGAITGRVRGTYYYSVKLWETENKIASECNCPVGQDGAFCKHCVAVGLAWLARSKQSHRTDRRLTARDVTDDEIRAHLLALDKSALVDLALEHAGWNSEFRDQLILMVAEKGEGNPDLAAFRAAIDKAIRHRGFIDYRRMPEYARGIEAVVDSLESLRKRGYAKAVKELAESALQRMESAMNDVDDSDGYMAGILDRLRDLHLAACRMENPDPLELAKSLFEWEISSDWEIFLDGAETYADVLGEVGMAEYRRLAEALWANVPALAPGDKDAERYGRRWRISRIMETLAKQSGDVEALVAVKSRDLSFALSFLEIAEIYKSAGKDDLALEWAERGARAFPERTDGRLREFLTKEYRHRKRHQDAIAIAWLSFRERPDLDNYVNLHKTARRAGHWSKWRERALALLRDEIAAANKRQAKLGWGRPDHSRLVDIFLWEGNVKAAWTEAKDGGCHDGLWLRLAKAREADHPEDAISVYITQLDRALQPAQQQAYEAAVSILRKIQPLKSRIGKDFEFVDLVRSVREQYMARRNLMKLLDVEGW